MSSPTLLTLPPLWIAKENDPTQVMERTGKEDICKQ